MGWTKRALISGAYEELGLQGYEFDISPEEQATALRRLDSMMAMWEARGIRVGYVMPTSPDASDADADSGLPDAAAEPVCLNLAVRLAPGLGKQVSPETRRTAKEGYELLLWAAARPPEQQLPSTMPRGAGNRIWRNSQRPFFPVPDTNPLQPTPGGDLDIQE